ncbi:flavodoxin family protein [Candidatus Bipolaricaulota bacterium]|nr:flavodoxin family protein [Candidatus Bipolaricaulota bacterium]
MKVLVVMSSQNAGGLTAACGEAARQGVVDGKSPARVINLNEFNIDRCAICNDGWGLCRTEHRCIREDDFSKLQEMFDAAEGLVLITPVYFGEPSETFKAFFDRLRRCEATKKSGTRSILADKPTVCVAAAGGSGGGAIHCLAEMERLVRQLGAMPFDYIPITQKTREYQIETIHDGLAAMCAPKAVEQTMPLSARKGTRDGKRGKRRIGRRRPAKES